jgi:hypothetical protein
VEIERLVTMLMILSDDREREIERLKRVAIKPHWASDTYAQAIAIDVIAAYGVLAVPALLEISQQAFGQTRKHALDRLSQLNSHNAL